ncbi:MAG: leucine-rich repeat domain-containing protein, partial [Anaeroplasmataceae bacterium]|nr:leucine-rich repeat domain-containing protein [Anaeroplasmataceae bacterium]
MNITIPTSVGSETTDACLYEVIDDKMYGYIGIGAFMDSSNMVDITFDEPCNVREIKDSTFENCEALTITTLPTSVKKIGSYAFYNCISLTEFTIKNVVVKLGSYAFANDEDHFETTSLTTVLFETGCQLATIEEGTFKNDSKLVMHELPDSITTIEDMAFENCCAEGFDEFTISDNVTFIGTAIFRGTTYLAKITIPFVGRENGIDENNTVDSYEMFGWIYGIEEGAEDINDNLNYTIEEVLDEVVITSDTHIAAYAFKNVDMITKVT